MKKDKLDKKRILEYINEEIKIARRNQKDYKKMAIKSINQNDIESNTNEFMNEIIQSSAWEECLLEIKELIRDGDFY